jgi:NADPH2:quinone reductase
MSLPETMTAIVVPAPGGPDALQPQRMTLPLVGQGEVLIRVAGAGVNYPDVQQRLGKYDPPPGASSLIGLEVAGEIAALGENATGFSIGDRVMALCNGGGYAEYVAVPAGQVLPLPKGWTMREAAALPETWFTVVQTLVMRAGLKPGMWVLVHGASGGIGGAAITISAALGAKPIAIVSSPEKAEYARSLGAVATVDHTTEDFVERTWEITAKHGADRVVDILGGHVTAKNVDASARGGHIVLVATLDGWHGGIQLGKIVSRHLTISGSTLRPQTLEMKASIAGRIRSDLWSALESPETPRPRIEYFPLAQAAEAHRRLERRTGYGKIVLLTAFGEAAEG